MSNYLYNVIVIFYSVNLVFMYKMANIKCHDLQSLQIRGWFLLNPNSPFSYINELLDVIKI